MHLLRLIVIIILVINYWFLQAQSLDNLLAKPEQIQSIDSLLSITLPDSLLKKPSYVIDSIRYSSDSLFSKLKLSYDSIQSMASSKVTMINQHIDSLKNLNLPTEKLMHKLDSIQGWKDKRLGDITTEAEKLREGVKKKIASLQLPSSLQEKASELTSLMDRLDISFPNRDLPLSIQDKLNHDIPSLSSAVNDMGLPDLPSTDMPSVNAPNITNGLQQLPGEILQVPASAESLSKLAEDQVSKISNVSDVEEELGKANELIGTAENLKDKEAIKEKLLMEAQQQAVDHFAGKETELNEAIEKLAKYKKKYGSFQNLEDLASRHRNVLHELPLRERLIPGITLQIFRKNSWMVDFNPYIGYRFNPRLTIGAGWNERIAYNFDNNQFNPNLRVYGPRSYAEHQVWRGYSAYLQIEYLNTWVPPQFSSTNKDAEGREWVFTPLAGMKKEFPFFKKVKGTFYMLYNLYDPHHRSPYTDKLIMRMGFEFPMKKKEPKTSREE